MAARELPTADTEGGSVLTDDYHPLDDLQRELFVAWRRNVQSVVLQSTRTPDRRVTRVLLGVLHPELTRRLAASSRRTRARE